MELTKKTTILLPPSLHTRLTELAATNGVSMGELIRRACEQTYGKGARERRLAAVEALARLDLPVGTVEEMKRESVGYPGDLPE